MNEDLIIKFAKKVGLPHWYQTKEVVNIKLLQEFANLIAEHERETIAKMIEDAPRLMDFVQNENGGCSICGFTPKIAAKSVREKWGRHE